jgi:hypothetical protein
MTQKKNKQEVQVTVEDIVECGIIYLIDGVKFANIFSRLYLISNMNETRAAKAATILKEYCYEKGLLSDNEVFVFKDGIEVPFESEYLVTKEEVAKVQKIEPEDLTAREIERLRKVVE